MKFEDAFNQFRGKYITTPRVMEIVMNQFGTDDITVLYYDKYDKSLPITVSSWEGFPVDVRGIISLRDGHEFVYDQVVANDPNSWDLDNESFCSNFYKSICKKITEYELNQMVNHEWLL